MLKVISFSVDSLYLQPIFLFGWLDFLFLDPLYILRILMLQGKIGNVFLILSLVFLLSLVFFSYALEIRRFLFWDFCSYLCNEIFQYLPIFWVLGHRKVFPTPSLQRNSSISFFPFYCVGYFLAFPIKHEKFLVNSFYLH